MASPFHQEAIDDAIAVVALARCRSAKRSEIDHDVNGLTALHDAVWHGHLEAAQALVETGARLDLRTHAAPGELASLYGYHDLVEFLAKAEQA